MWYTTAMEKKAFLVLVCGALLSAGAGDLSLAVRGAPAAYAIVVPADASPSQKYAAEELRDYTEKMTGVKLPIATDAAPLPAKAILIGETKYSRGLVSDAQERVPPVVGSAG